MNMSTIERLNDLVNERTAMQSALSFFDRMSIEDYDCNGIKSQTGGPERYIFFFGAASSYGVSIIFTRKFASYDEAYQFRLGFAVLLGERTKGVRNYEKLAEQFIAETAKVAA
jgi:hypothetical protein